MAISIEDQGVQTGIGSGGNQAVAEGLAKLLADTYTLYLKTQNFHWNVTGPHFDALHRMFEQQYTELAAAVDEIAERIRALGFPAPGTYRTFATLASVPEQEGVPRAQDMVRLLVGDQETVIRTARTLVPVAEREKDIVTVDLLTRRVQVHEKTAWMLRSQLA
jgi:starvation-inducible DNA-binding protein